jgi:hypothetical protein
MIVKAAIRLEDCRTNERRASPSSDRRDHGWVLRTAVVCPLRSLACKFSPDRSSGAYTVPCNDNTNPAGANKTFACSVGFGRRHQVGLPNDILEESRPWGWGTAFWLPPREAAANGRKAIFNVGFAYANVFNSSLAYWHASLAPLGQFQAFLSS